MEKRAQMRLSARGCGDRMEVDGASGEWLAEPGLLRWRQQGGRESSVAVAGFVSRWGGRREGAVLEWIAGSMAFPPKQDEPILDFTWKMNERK